MTDFFSELEGHLHTAARRRARRAPRIVLAVAVAAAVVVAVIAGLGTLEYGEPEVAAPGPVVHAGDQDCDRPPQAVLDRFAVLRREPNAEDDSAPDEVIDRLAQDFPGVGLPARVWPEAGRLARAVDGKRFWLFPVLLGKTCEPPLRHTDVPPDRPREPGICWVVDARDVNTAFCHALREVERPISLLMGEGREPYVTGLVPDGRTAIGRNGETAVEGTTIGNIFYAEGATEVEDARPQSRTGCQVPTLAEDAPPPELLDIVPGFRQAPYRMPPEQWRKALGGNAVRAHVNAARGFGTHGGMDIFGVPYSPLPESCAIEGAPREAGICLIAAPDRSEYFLYCFTGSRIRAGTAVVRDLDIGLVYALVPAGTRGAKLGGQTMRLEGDFAYLFTGDTTSRMELVR